MSPKSIFTLFCFLGLFCVAPAVSGEEAVKPSTEPTRVGLFVVSIFNVDPNRGSYTVLFYVWCKGSATDQDPLDSIEFPRAITTTKLSQSEETVGSERRILRAYRCEMLNQWDLHSYPFDDHTLSVVFRVSNHRPGTPAIDLDSENSGIAQKSLEGGWQISDFRLFTYRPKYHSNFGALQPDGGMEPEWIVASFKLARVPWVLFFRLMSGAYISVFIALLGCLLKTYHAPVFSGRVSTQVACLLAAVVNQREIGSSIGARSFYSLPDALHVLCYLCILAAFLITLRSRKFNDAEQPENAARWEKRISLVTLAVFIAANFLCAWLIIEPNAPQDLTQIVEIGN